MSANYTQLSLAEAGAGLVWCEFVQKNTLSGWLDGWMVGWLVGGMVGESRNKANSARLKLELG